MRHCFRLHVSLLSVLLLAVAAPSMAQAPPNDEYGSATEIAAPGTYTGTNVGATRGHDEFGSPCAPGGPAGDGHHSVWWVYRPAEDGRLTLDLSGSGFDTIASIQNTAYGPGAEDACDDDSGDGDRSRIEGFPVRQGAPYRIRVSGPAGEMGDIVMEVQLDPPALPANDDRADAATLSAEGLYFETFLEATSEPGEPGASCTDLPIFPDIGRSLWWVYTAPADTTVTVDFPGSAFLHPLLSLHDEDGTELVCDDQRIERYPVAAGQTIYVRVSSEDAGPENDLMTFGFWTGDGGRPANDDRANAAPIMREYSYGGTNVGATPEPGEPGASCTPGGPENDTGQSIWWRYEPANDEIISVDMGNSSLDGVVSIHDSTGAEIACDPGLPTPDDPDDDPFIEAASVEGGEVYFVRISGYLDGSADPDPTDNSLYFSFSTTPALVNDDVADATAIPEPGSYFGTTVTATAEADEEAASCVGHRDMMTSVWWTYTAPSDGTLFVDIFGSEHPLVLTLHDSDLTELVCKRADIDLFPVTAGQEVLIRMSGYRNSTNPQSGDVVLTLDLGAPAQMSTVATGTTADTPFWDRPNINGQVGFCNPNSPTIAHHDPVSLTVPVTGLYSFSGTFEDYWGCLVLYEESINLDDTCENLVVGSCFPVEGAEIEALTLSAGVSYVLVATAAYYSDGSGPYEIESLGPAPVNFNPTVASETGAAPGEAALSAVHPNPVRGRAAFTLSLARPERVTVAVFDVLGRRVAVLHEGPLAAGAHALTLDGSALPAGVYLVRAAGETFGLVQRATLVR